MMRSTESICVSPLAPSDEAAWDGYVLNHLAGSFFHQLSWKRVMEKTFGYQAHYFLSKRNGEITGIAPTFLTCSWLTGRALLSLPFAVYGGICASDQESERALLDYLEKHATDLRVDYLELRNRTRAMFPGFVANERYSTFTIPLSRDIDALYRNFPKDIRYMIRKGEKAGLRCVRGVDQLDQFYRLMTVNLRRLGTPAFPRELFQNLISEYPGQVDLTVLYLNDAPIAGGMSFLFRDTLQPYYIGSTEQAKTLAANNLLWWELIKFGAEAGCSTFDFGRSKKNSGNFDFKKKWNPKIEPLDYQVRLVRRQKAPDFSPANPKFDLATSVWKRIPLAMTRMLGPYLVRWFP